MKLFPPQPDITLYQTGFAGEPEGLNRRKEGERLSALVERIEDPMVVAVDGPWGSGKTHFLKRWVGAHRNENDGEAQTIYFDAFASDYLDDPLIALTGAIDNRLEQSSTTIDLRSLKQAAVRLAGPFSRISLATVTAGLSEMAGPAVDAALGEAGASAADASDAFWARSNDRRAAMGSFREALVALTEPADGEDGSHRPLVVVIDELDRCRPDYALSLLEVVKHFFAVPAVHFVLGVNIKALQLSVQARYGAKIDANDYLKRFITLTMPLAEHLNEDRRAAIQLSYFDHAANAMEIEPPIREIFRKHIRWIVANGLASLRDIERLLTNIALLPNRNLTERLIVGWQHILVSLSIMKVLRPQLFEEASKGRLSIDAVRTLYGFRPEHIQRERDGQERSIAYDHQAYIIDAVWHYLISNGVEPVHERAMIARLLDDLGERPGTLAEVVGILRRDHIDQFTVAE